jgi:hypothetical protein
MRLFHGFRRVLSVHGVEVRRALDKFIQSSGLGNAKRSDHLR